MCRRDAAAAVYRSAAELLEIPRHWGSGARIWEDDKMRKTKIVCTIGPACEDEQTLIEMVKAGMNVARLNFSHGKHEEHQEKIDLIKAVR